MGPLDRKLSLGGFMKNSIEKMMLVLFLLASVYTYADGPGWTAVSEVKNLVVVASGGINVELSPDLNGCTFQSGYGPNYASIYPDHPGLNAMQSNLLAAMMSGKKVRLYLYDSNCKVVEIILVE